MSEKHKPFYYPGEEPEEIKQLLDKLFYEIREVAPNWVIRKSEWVHDWDKLAGYLCNRLGYANGTEFLSAYGFRVIDDAVPQEKSAIREQKSTAPREISKHVTKVKTNHTQREALLQKNNKGAGKKIVVVLLIIVALCMAGAGVYLFLEKNLLSKSKDNVGSGIPSFETDDKLEELLQPVFDSRASNEEKATVTISILKDLQNKGDIINYSEYDSESESISFTYGDTSLGRICFAELSDDTFGGGISTNSDTTTLVTSQGFTRFGFPAIDNLSMLILDAAGFPDLSDYHKESANYLREKGVNVVYNDSVTVSDIGQLIGYDIVLINAHGFCTEGICSFVLTEECTKETDIKYQTELTVEHSIEKHLFTDGKKYNILPKFFTCKYGDAGVPSKLTLLLSCSTFGSQKSDGSNNYNYSLADAILGQSNNCCIGFYNVVTVEYGTYLSYHIIDAMFSGYSAGAAIQEATTVLGYNEQNYGIEIHGDRPSWILLRGNYDSSFYGVADNTIMTIDAAKAYQGLLESEYVSIQSYDWMYHDTDITEDKIAFENVYGDETPELIYLRRAQNNPYWAEVRIYTVSNGMVRQLASKQLDQIAGGGGYYCFLKTNFSPFLFLYSGMSDTTCDGNISVFVPEGDVLIEIPQFHVRKEWEIDNLYSELMGIVEIERTIEADRTARMMDNLYDNTEKVLQFDRLLKLSYNDNEDIKSKAANSTAMTYQEAINYLKSFTGEAATESEDSIWLSYYQPVLDCAAKVMVDLKHHSYTGNYEYEFDYEICGGHDGGYQLGYRLQDFDNNGVPELIIGLIDANLNEGYWEKDYLSTWFNDVVVAVFTLGDNHKPIQLLRSVTRGPYFLSSLGDFHCHGSGGAVYLCDSIEYVDGVTMKTKNNYWLTTTSFEQYGGERADICYLDLTGVNLIEDEYGSYSVCGDMYPEHLISEDEYQKYCEELKKTIIPIGELTPIEVIISDYHEELDSLKELLQQFYLYLQYTGGEYDSTTPDAISPNILEKIIGNESCTLYDLYPGEDNNAVWNAVSFDNTYYDPQHRYEWSFCYDAEKIDWILSNIFNCSAESIQKMRQQGDSPSSYYYYQDGKYYKVYGAKDGAFEVRINDSYQENEKVYVNFSVYSDPNFVNDYIGDYSAVVELKKISGNYYWSIYSCE